MRPAEVFAFAGHRDSVPCVRVVIHRGQEDLIAMRFTAAESEALRDRLTVALETLAQGARMAKGSDA